MIHTHRLLHMADYQVKIRDRNLTAPYTEVLDYIEGLLVSQKIDIYIIPGDFFEYAASNDAEKKIVYKHLSKVLAIPTILELVLMNGNHDLFSDKKEISSNRGNNAIDTYVALVNKLEPELAKKITYLKDQKQYMSVCRGLSYVSYSIEDGPSNGRNIDRSLITTDTFNIDVYHDILREYAVQVKLPIKKDRMDAIACMDDFSSSLILAGDIHEDWELTRDGKTFIYPGSPIQRNHGEGSYVKIRKLANMSKAAKKFVKIFTINFDDETRAGSHSGYKVELPTYISYVTFDMTTQTPTENWSEIVERMFGLIEWGVHNTFIKFKLSTAYTKHELQLMKIAHEFASRTTSSVEINCSYDKFVLSAENTEIVGGDDTEEIPEQTMDDLILDNEKLEKLFEKTLEKFKEPIRKEFQDEKDVSFIMDSIMKLFSEQLAFSMKSTANFNVEMMSAECNSFMALGPNKIRLDIPGLTRITGTNGIGKTTLYNMIRWVYKNEVIEGLSKSTKVKNALLVFNDKMINVDKIMARVTQKINGTQVAITRSATRIWKSTATEEQKCSLKWKDYITGVDQHIEVAVLKGEETIKKTGEEAQRMIDQWFGDVPNTIMILNQQKILSMLNMSADELKQLVLNYIGVDYLNVLEDNLENVKAHYNLARPKLTKDELKARLLVALETKKNSEELVSEYEKSIEVDSLELQEYKNLIDKEQQKQIDLGNIPSLIETTENDLKLLSDKAGLFVGVEKKELLPFLEKEPLAPENRDADKLELEAIAEKIKVVGNKIVTREQSITESWLAIETLAIERRDLGAENHREAWQKVREEFATYVVQSKDTLDRAGALMLIELANLNSQFSENKKKRELSLQELKDNIKAINDKMAEYSNQLISGVCSLCGKAVNDDHDEWELKKVEMETYISEQKPVVAALVEQSAALQTKISQITEYLFQFSSIEQFVNNDIWHKIEAENKYYYGELAACAAKIIEARIVWEENVLWSKNAANENIEYLTREPNLFGQQPILDIVKHSRDQEYYQGLLDFTLRKNLDMIRGNIEDQPEVREIIAHIEVQNTKIVSYREENAKHLEDVKTLTDRGTLETNKYIEDLEGFQKRLTANNQHNDTVRTHNEKVDRDGEENRIMLGKIDTAKILLENHQLKRPQWDETVSNVMCWKDRQKHYEERLDNTKLALQRKRSLLETTKLDIDQIEQDITDYIDWQRKSKIFEVYQKLIRRDFRDMIFNYYRLFLNNTLNILLQDLSFKLFWDESGDLFMVEIKNGNAYYRPVKLVSGMETAFQGLALIYAIHLLNVKNGISNIFIDEISGQLNTGKELTKKENITNYQEQLLLLLSKFDQKSVFIIDHVIEQMFETQTYEVIPSEKGGQYVIV